MSDEMNEEGEKGLDGTVEKRSVKMVSKKIPSGPSPVPPVTSAEKKVIDGIRPGHESNSSVNGVTEDQEKVDAPQVIIGGQQSGHAVDKNSTDGNFESFWKDGAKALLELIDSNEKTKTATSNVLKKSLSSSFQIWSQAPYFTDWLVPLGKRIPEVDKTIQRIFARHQVVDEILGTALLIADLAWALFVNWISIICGAVYNDALVNRVSVTRFPTLPRKMVIELLTKGLMERGILDLLGGVDQITGGPLRLVFDNCGMFLCNWRSGGTWEERCKRLKFGRLLLMSKFPLFPEYVCFGLERWPGTIKWLKALKRYADDEDKFPVWNDYITDLIKADLAKENITVFVLLKHPKGLKYYATDADVVLKTKEKFYQIRNGN